MISRVDDFCVLRFYLCIYRYGSSLSVYSTLRRILAAVSQTIKFQLLYSLLVSHTQTRVQKTIRSFTSQHSSTGSPTIVYFKLAKLSRRKGHNYADSQADSQVGSQACRCLGWQKHGVNEIGEASPQAKHHHQAQQQNKTISTLY